MFCGLSVMTAQYNPTVDYIPYPSPFTLTIISTKLFSLQKKPRFIFTVFPLKRPFAGRHVNIDVHILLNTCNFSPKHCRGYSSRDYIKFMQVYSGQGIVFYSYFAFLSEPSIVERARNALRFTTMVCGYCGSDNPGEMTLRDRYCDTLHNIRVHIQGEDGQYDCAVLCIYYRWDKNHHPSSESYDFFPNSVAFLQTMMSRCTVI